MSILSMCENVWVCINVWVCEEGIGNYEYVRDSVMFKAMLNAAFFFVSFWWRIQLFGISLIVLL